MVSAELLAQSIPASTDQLLDLPVSLPRMVKISNVKSFPVTSVVIPCTLLDNSLFRCELARRSQCGLAELNVADSGIVAPNWAQKVDKFPVFFPVNGNFRQRQVRR